MSEHLKQSYRVARVFITETMSDYNASTQMHRQWLHASNVCTIPTELCHPQLSKLHLHNQQIFTQQGYIWCMAAGKVKSMKPSWQSHLKTDPAQSPFFLPIGQEPSQFALVHKTNKLTLSRWQFVWLPEVTSSFINTTVDLAILITHC